MLKINNKVLKINGDWLNPVVSPEPPVPEPLPLYTLRLLFKDGVTPTFSKGTGVQLSTSPNIWDLTYENSEWYLILSRQYDLLEVIDINTAGVTDMRYMFERCTSLTSVSLFDTSTVTNMNFMFTQCTSLTNIPLFDTSNVTSMNHMFNECTSLTSVPLLNTSKVTNMSYMLYNCTNVQSGALALYNQASSQTNPPTYHEQTFGNCGRDTATGSAELAQIPSSWGGTGT